QHHPTISPGTDIPRPGRSRQEGSGTHRRDHGSGAGAAWPARPETPPSAPPSRIPGRSQSLRLKDPPDHGSTPAGQQHDAGGAAGTLAELRTLTMIMGSVLLGMARQIRNPARALLFHRRVHRRVNPFAA